LLAKPFVLSLSKHERFAVRPGFSRPSFDRLRTNGKILNITAQQRCERFLQKADSLKPRLAMLGWGDEISLITSPNYSRHAIFRIRHWP
jgi:hypothetical protein